MQIETVFDSELTFFLPQQQDRPAGLHLSDIYMAMAKEFYPKWFKDYEDEEKEKQIKHFEKGLILEEAWGNVMQRMLRSFARPPCQQSTEGVWCSPDGCMDTSEGHWPPMYPPLHIPSIHECKVTLKSCSKETSPITHEKFIPWMWQVKGYCHVWDCLHAYIHAFHLLGDYGKRPWSPIFVIHHLEFTPGEIEENWDRLISFARERGMLI